jgi:hypothetical protein
VREHLIDVGFVILLSICAGVVLTVCGLMWLFLGGKAYEE